MFFHNSQCYAVLPKHVAGPFPRVTVTTAAPVISATGTAVAPFWDGLDLALLVVRGVSDDRCTGKLDSLRSIGTARGSASAQLLRLSPTGEELRDDLAIENRTYLTFEGVVAAGAREVTQGTSGAFAFVGNQPIGMAFSSENTTRARFMRAEEIFLHANRYLSEQGVAYLEERKEGGTPVVEPGQVALELAGTNLTAINPQFAPENLLEAGIFVFEQSRNMRVDFRVAGDNTAAIEQIRMTAPEGADYAKPKTILVQFSVARAGGSYSTFARGQMAPDGIFDTGRLAPRNARRISVIIIDTWSSGPVAIDQVVVN